MRVSDNNSNDEKQEAFQHTKQKASAGLSPNGQKALQYADQFSARLLPLGIYDKKKSEADNKCAKLPLNVCTKCACRLPPMRQMVKVSCRKCGAEYARGETGVHLATSDTQLLTSIWSTFPNAGVGWAMGPQGDGRVLVAIDVDVDKETGKPSEEWLALLAKHGELPITPRAVTGSGGQHYVFEVEAADALPKNSVRKLADGVDTRGEGGYIAVFPTVHPNGKRYKWHPEARPTKTPIAKLPEWLAERLRPAPVAAPEPVTERTRTLVAGLGDNLPLAKKLDAYVTSALDGEAGKVAGQPKGGRNRALNDAAFSLGHYVAGGLLSRADVEARLESAAAENGSWFDDGPDECKATIASGLTAGMAKPKTVEMVVQKIIAKDEAKRASRPRPAAASVKPVPRVARAVGEAGGAAGSQHGQQDVIDPATGEVLEEAAVERVAAAAPRRMAIVGGTDAGDEAIEACEMRENHRGELVRYEDGKRVIRYEIKHQERLYEECCEAILSLPDVFTNNVGMVQIGKEKRDISSSQIADVHVVRPVDRAEDAAVLLSRAAHVVAYDGNVKGDTYRAIKTSWAGGAARLAKVDVTAHGARFLKGIVHTATLRPDFSVLQTPGYDEATNLYASFHGSVTAVPDAPGKKEAFDALQKLERLIDGFAFKFDPDTETHENNAARSALLSGIITAATRSAMDLSPTLAILANRQNSGKSLAARTLLAIMLGHEPASIVADDRPGETDKRIDTELLACARYIFLDNWPEGHMYGKGATIAQMATSPNIKIRNMGSNKAAPIVKNEVLAIVTANNLQVARDVERRMLNCWMEAERDMKESRRSGHCPVADAKANYHDYIAAALTIVRAWNLEGRPVPEGHKAFDSFQQWDAIVRCPLLWLGCADPCQTVKSGGIADDEEAMAQFLEAWDKSPKTTPGQQYSAGELVRFATCGESLTMICPSR